VDPRAELDGGANSHPLRDPIPGPPSHSKVQPFTDKKDANQMTTYWEEEMTFTWLTVS